MCKVFKGKFEILLFINIRRGLRMRKKEKIVGSIVMVLVFIVFLAVGYGKGRSNTYNDSNIKDIFVDSDRTEKVDSGSLEDKSIKVEIKGEVKNPGVYLLQNGSRVEDLILKAGGYTDNADRDNMISMAKKLRDEECIIVRIKEDPQAGSPRAEKPISGINSEGRVNINIATKEELKTVPGIGDVTAQKIIDYREKFGAFNTVEDLKKIDRIGDKILNNMREKIDVK
jgi:competence protein ComEA